MSLHLTYVAVMAEVFCAKAPAPVVGEHAHGAMHLHGPPLRTDAHGWAVGVVGDVLSRAGGASVAPAEAPAGSSGGSGLGARSASQTKGTELKPRSSTSGRAGEHGVALLSAPQAGEHAHDDEEEGGAAAGALPAAAAGEHAMPEHANGFMRVLRITRDRLLHNPMVIGAAAVRCALRHRACACRDCALKR